MADKKPDKALEEALKKEEQNSKKEVVTVCTLNLRQILVALHEKALENAEKASSGEVKLTVLNSAIEGAGGKNAKFYGAGLHIVAAIPKDNKGLDKNKVEKKDAVPVLQAYVQWFVGPDLKDKVKENVLKPLEDGAEGKVADNHEKKEDIEKSRKDSVAGEKYEKESTIFVPSFSQYLITEEGEEDAASDLNPEDAAKEQAKKDKDSVEGKNAEDSAGVEGKPGEGPNQAQGWYVEYKMTIPGLKEHPIADALKGFAADLLKAVGIKFTSLFGGADGKVHTVGDFVDAWDSVFGKMDASEFEAKFNEELRKRMKGTDASAKIWDTPTILKYLKQEVSKHKAKLAKEKYALCVKVDKRDKSYKLFNEDAIANIANAAIPGPMRGLVQKLKFKISGKDIILVNNYSDNKKDKEDNKYTSDKETGSVADSQIINSRKPLIVDSKTIKNRNLLETILNECFDFDNAIKLNSNDMSYVSNELLENMFVDLDESLLLEGHSEEQINVEKEIDRIGVENLTNNVDDLRKNYLDYLAKVKKDNQKNSYVLKIEVNSKNWISKEFIGKLRDQKEASTDTVKKMLKDCVSRVGKTNDIRFELQALVDALKKLPDGPKKDEDDSDKITITFRDIDDPGELSDPEAPTDEDKEKYKTIGDPIKLVPGEDVDIPEVKNKGDWEFMGFDPDPENMDESGYTYAIYTKNGPDTVKLTFYDADPETGDKLKEPLGKPIEIKIGEPVNSSEEAQKAFEEYNDKLEKEKKDGYVFKGWNPDPSTKAKEDIDIVAKYIEEDEKDTKYTVMFQYAPDQEKPNDTEVIQVDGKDEQEVLAGEKAERPEVPEIDGYTFKDWGDDELNLDNVQDDIVAVAQYIKQITITPKAPKDPEKPTENLEPFGDPIKYDPNKNLKEELPEPPEKEGWKITGEWDPDPKTIKDPTEDIDIVPKYEKAKGNKNGIKLIFRAPKDPENPPKDPKDGEIIGGKPIEYDPDLEIKDLAPTPPEIKGWHFKDWSPKLEEIKDPKESVNIIALYEKGAIIAFKIPDPKFPKKDTNLLKDIIEPIQVNSDNIQKLKYPNPKSAEIPDGFELDEENPWTISEEKLKSDYIKDNKLVNSKGKLISQLNIVLRLKSKKDFIIKVVDVDAEKPDDETQEKDIAQFTVIFNAATGNNIYKAAEIKKLADNYRMASLPDEKLVDRLFKIADDNDNALKEIEKFKNNTKGDYSLNKEKLENDIENAVKNPPELSDDRKIVKVKTSYNKEQFKVSIVNPDPEDPDNTKSQEPITTIVVFMQGDSKFYKSEDLAELAKKTESKTEADKYNKAAKDNEAAFKQVENIAKMAEKNKPYKFLGWTGPNTEDGKTEELEKIIDNGPADGEETIVVKAKYSNDMKAKHTDLDFYIIPMKGLKDKEKKSK